MGHLSFDTGIRVSHLYQTNINAKLKEWNIIQDFSRLLDPPGELLRDEYSLYRLGYFKSNSDTRMNIEAIDHGFPFVPIERVPCGIEPIAMVLFEVSLEFLR